MNGICSHRDIDSITKCLDSIHWRLQSFDFSFLQQFFLTELIISQECSTPSLNKTNIYSHICFSNHTILSFFYQQFPLVRSECSRYFEHLRLMDKLKGARLFIEQKSCNVANGVIPCRMHLVVLNRSNTDIRFVFSFEINNR